MKVRIVICVIAALLVFSGASPWEGAAVIAPEGELPAAGRFIATNSYPVNTIVDITNIENNRSTRAIVANSLNSPGLLAIVSREAAELLGMRPGSVIRIRMVQPSDPIAYLRFTEGANANIPDYDSGNVITEDDLLDDLYRNDPYRPPSGDNSTAQANGARGPSYTLEQEWRGRFRDITDLPGSHPPLNVPNTQPPVDPTPQPSVDPTPQPPVETPIVTEQPRNDVDKSVYEYITNPPRGEVDKENTEYITNPPRGEVDKNVAGYLVDALRNEADKDVADYITEVLRNEADKDAADYLTEILRNETDKDLAGYLAEVLRNEANKEVADYLVEILRYEANKEAADYLAEVLRNEAYKDLADYLAEILRNEAYKNLSPYIAGNPPNGSTAPPPDPGPGPVPTPDPEPGPVPTPGPNEQPLNIVSTTPRPPSTVYGIDLMEIFPDTPAAARPAVPVTPAPPDAVFSIPRIYALDRGSYYVQLAALDSPESVETTVRQIDRNFQPKVFKDTDNRYRILLGPLNQGESAAVLQRFKSIGFRDAFVRRGS